MIPRVSRLGNGFVGAGFYYLHDKRPDGMQMQRPSAEEYMLHDKNGAQSSNRLGFVELRNLPVRNPEPDNQQACYEAAQKSLRCMAWLAAHAKDVRQAAVAGAARAVGMSYAGYVSRHNPYRGRPGTKPLYSLSIAWHPDKQKKPTPQEMLAAADEVLATLGMADRQCVIIQHTDTRHPHLHLIINRVSPENGLYAKVSNDWLKLSAWSLEYERRTGFILCTERMFNWEQRKGYREEKAKARESDPKAKGRYARGANPPRADRDWWNAHKHLPPAEIRAARVARQEREAKQFTAEQARRLLLTDAKLTRRYGRQLGHVLNELRSLQAERKARPKRRGIVGSVIQAIRKTAQAITRVPARRRGTIERLRASAQDLRVKIDDGKKDGRTRYAQDWTRMERRHEAERKRDEQRIARMQSQARGRATGERAIKQFNARGDADAARHLQPAAPPLILTHAHLVVAGKEIGERIQRDTALARLARNLGGPPIEQDRSRAQSLVRSGPLPVTPENHPANVKAPFGQAAASDAVRPEATRSQYETAVERELKKIEAREGERIRRRRKRPRAKSRKMD